MIVVMIFLALFRFMCIVSALNISGVQLATKRVIAIMITQAVWTFILAW